MTDQQILQQAIQRAIDRGFDKGAAASWIKRLITDEPEESRRFCPMLIFNPDFAKALWGEELLQYPEEDNYTCTAKMAGDFSRSDELFVWQYHLQQMVIASKPIKYLGENI